VIDVEPLIISGLDRLIALPSGEGADWQAVLSAAGMGRRARVIRLRLVIAVACLAAVGAVVVATPVGATLGHGFDAFTTWVSGSPGKPASRDEQRAFNQATRSWSGFPQGTELRQLVQTREGGANFALEGFRGARSLCLRLSVSGSESARTLICPPLAALRGSQQPALVVAANFGVGTSRQTSTGPFSFATPKFLVTFGVIADGVQRVELIHADGTTSLARLNSDSFLAVEQTTSPVTRAFATAGSRRVSLSLTAFPSPYGGPQTSGPQLSAQGPREVQRVVHGGAIRWLARREPRGMPVPHTVHNIVGVLPDVIFHREITPDPAAPERMVVSVRPAGAAYGPHLRNKLQVCAEVVGGRFTASGCWPAGRLFSTAPFSFALSEQAGLQTTTIAGLASDEVTKLTLYLATGREVSVPLRDNGYLINAVKADYPLRLVARDSAGRVIGIKTLANGQETRRTGPMPVANAHWTTVVRNRIGSVFTAPSTTGGSCYAIRVGTVTNGPTCAQAPSATALQVGVGWNKQGTEITGRAGSAIAHVIIRLRNGQTQTITPVRGYVLAAAPPPASANPNADPVLSITALGANGQALATGPRTSLSGGSGTVKRLTAAAIMIGSGQRERVCRITQHSPSLDGYSDGMHVQYLCQDGVLSLIGRSLPAKSTTWASRTIRIEGVITKLDATSISIKNNLAPGGSTGTATCALTEQSPRTDRYHRGQHVQAFCSHQRLTGINREFP
jgi:hypothetical protein